MTTTAGKTYDGAVACGKDLVIVKQADGRSVSVPLAELTAAARCSRATSSA